MCYYTVYFIIPAPLTRAHRSISRCEVAGERGRQEGEGDARRGTLDGVSPPPPYSLACTPRATSTGQTHSPQPNASRGVRLAGAPAACQTPWCCCCKHKWSAHRRVTLKGQATVNRSLGMDVSTTKNQENQEPVAERTFPRLQRWVVDSVFSASRAVLQQVQGQIQEGFERQATPHFFPT